MTMMTPYGVLHKYYMDSKELYLPTLSCLPYTGELFDHGFDSWSTIFLPMSCYSNLGLGRWVGGVDDVYLPCVAGMVGFYCTHWEKYITGTLYLPWAYDITMLVGILMQISMVCSQYTSDCMKYLLGGCGWYCCLGIIEGLRTIVG